MRPASTHDESSEQRPYGASVLGPAGQSARQLRVRVQLLLTAVLVTTNLIGAGLVFLISQVVIPGPASNRATVVSTAVGVPVYVAVAVVLGGFVGTTATLRALRWALDDDAVPTEAERARVFRVPWRLTLVQLVLWLGGTALFTFLALLVQPERALTTGLTVGTATVVVCGIAYLLTEFTMRPVTARALVQTRATDRPRGAGIRTRMTVFWAVGTGAPASVLVAAGILGLTDATDPDRLAAGAIVLGAVVLLFGGTVTVLGARAVEAPLRSVQRGMRRVEGGALDAEVVVYDGTELGLLQAGFNHMVGELRERERLRDLFGRHVGRQVAQMAASGVDEVELGGEVRVVSVLFVDLTGSTGYAEEHGPTRVVDLLNRFFGIVIEEVDREGGLVNKFMGDAVLALFGAPVANDDHASGALAAGRRLAERLAEEVPEIDFGVGVATGDVVVGHVGDEQRFEYTAIGDAVNTAARLSDLAKKTPGRLRVTGASVEATTDAERDHWSAYEREVLRGRRDETETFAVR